MAEISDDAFGNTLDALAKYADSQRQKSPDKPRLLLRLCKENGQVFLKAVPESELSTRQKVASILGLSSFSFRRIVNYLQSSAFTNKLAHTPLEAEKRQIIEGAAHSLDLKIKKFNLTHFFSLETKRKSLTWTLSEHLVEHEARATSKAYQLMKNTSQAQTPISLPEKLHPAFFVLTIDAKRGHFSKCLERLNALEGIPADEFTSECQKLLEFSHKICEKKLSKDIKKGRTTITKLGVRISTSKHDWYTDFVKLHEHLSALLGATNNQKTVLQLINHATILQAVHKCSQVSAVKPAAIQLCLMQEFCKAKGLRMPPHNKLALEQAEALKKLLTEPEILLLEPKALEKKIEETKRVAYLSACKVPKEALITWDTALVSLLQTRFHIMQAQAQQRVSHEKEIRCQELPEIGKQKLIGAYRSMQARQLEGQLEHFVRVHARKLVDGSLSLEEWQNGVKKQIDPKRIALELAHFRQETAMAHMNFYKKWQGYLKKEMSQGFADSGEVLGSGICWGIALRWAIEELKTHKTSSIEHIIEQLDVGKTTTQDRRMQAIYLVSKQLSDHDLELKRLKRSLGVARSEAFVVAEELQGKNAIAKSLSRLVDDSEFQDRYKGVSQLSVSWQTNGHAICFVAKIDKDNPQNSVFRFSDPNYGTYDFPVEEASLEALEAAKQSLCLALSELLATFYSPKLNYIRATCFELTKTTK